VKDQPGSCQIVRHRAIDRTACASLQYLSCVIILVPSQFLRVLPLSKIVAIKERQRNHRYVIPTMFWNGGGTLANMVLSIFWCVTEKVMRPMQLWRGLLVELGVQIRRTFLLAFDLTV
jgi:hypothetical protein